MSIVQVHGTLGFRTLIKLHPIDLFPYSSGVCILKRTFAKAFVA